MPNPRETNAPTPATPAQLSGRKCVVCGLVFRSGESGVVYGTVAGGPVFRHELCPCEDNRGGTK